MCSSGWSTEVVLQLWQLGVGMADLSDFGFIGLLQRLRLMRRVFVTRVKKCIQNFGGRNLLQTFTRKAEKKI